MQKRYLVILMSLFIQLQVFCSGVDDSQKNYQKMAVGIQKILHGRKYIDAGTNLPNHERIYKSRDQRYQDLDIESYFNERFHYSLVGGISTADDFKKEYSRIRSQAHALGYRFSCKEHHAAERFFYYHFNKQGERYVAGEYNASADGWQERHRLIVNELTTFVQRYL